MDKVNTLLKDFVNADVDFLKKESDHVDEFFEQIYGSINQFKNEVKKFKKTGRWTGLDLGQFGTIGKNLNSAELNTPKENVNPQEQSSARSKRNATMNKNYNEKEIDSVRVKMEKLSTMLEEAEIPENIQIKTEAEQMPAPKLPAPRKKKQENIKTELVVKRTTRSNKKNTIASEQDLDERRSTRSKTKNTPVVDETETEISTNQIATSVKVKKEKIESAAIVDKKKDSDVVIKDVPIELIEISDSDESFTPEKTKKPQNSKTTVKKPSNKEQNKRNRNYSSEEEEMTLNKKRSKSDSGNEEVVESLQDGRRNILNATTVVENPVHDLKTDPSNDDASQVASKIPKQIFSPYEHSPVKKKVAAFEKLNMDTAAVKPTRKVLQKATAEGTKDSGKNAEKKRSKLCTPVLSKFLPASSSTSKIMHKHPGAASPQVSNDARTLSSLKASQYEFREREMQRREKELDAQRKKEALLQAQIEEKKRKREEKQLKAQQQREIIEKSKLKELEHQRIKEERHKELLAKQAKEKQKQREEAERKRQLVKQKALDERKKEEERMAKEKRKFDEIHAKLAKQEGKIVDLAKKQNQPPVYMGQKEPLLPTHDCYDSDQAEDEKVKRSTTPEWATAQTLEKMQKCMFYCGEKMKNTFFCCQAQSPNLQDIFETIDLRKLKRTSSAIWHKPPRYTLMPNVEKYEEEMEYVDSD